MAQQGPQNGSPALWLDLSQSNNPFLRNSISSNPTSPPLGGFNNQGLHSPASLGNNTPASPFDDQTSARPLSRNPFLDPSLSSTNRPRSSLGTMNPSQTAGGGGSPAMTVDEIFNSLDINQPADALIDTSTPESSAPPRDEQAHRQGPPFNRPPHRSENSESKMRRPAPPRPNGPPGQRPPRPRRNSDSSTIDLSEKPITEDEMKLIQAKRMEDMRKNAPKRKPRGLDIIDQLDCTGLYTMHHDGPFDAVTSHRNRKGSRRAPMQAFPEGSLNNTLGGSGPLNARADHASFLGNGDAEAFRDYSTGAVAKSYREDQEGAVFDAKSQGEVIHGDESIGLGTSTFLQGTPAARTAIQKAEQDKADQVMTDGLQRKKSLAHRLRNMKQSGGYTGPPGGRFERSAGGYRHGDMASAPISEERDPFDEYRPGGDELDFGKPSSPPVGDEGFSVPKGMERRATTDSFEDGAKPGFISRMKSLKGNRRRPSDVQHQTLPGPAS
jgi:hypothetical protein